MIPPPPSPPLSPRGADRDRFGATPQLTTPAGSPLSIVTAPLPALRDRNVELVLAPPTAVRNGLLLPVFQSTETPGARVMEYPVHKTVLRMEGVRGMLAVGAEGGERVLRVVGDEVVEPGVTGVDGVLEWVLAGTQGGEKVFKPAVRALLRDVFGSARAGLEGGRKKKLGEEEVGGGRGREGGDTAESIAAAIAAWSTAAHMELKEATEGGFKGREWAKLEWWKLLWRIDDVGVVSRRVIESGFLPASDDRAGFLAGRMFGAGFGARQQVRTEAGDIVEVDEDPRPGHIRDHREEIVRADVPRLQAAGLKYLLSSLSTAGLSGAFSALLVMSDVSLYSSLTVAAVGTVGSARWLQSRWMRERRRFQDTVREKGREAIVESERWAWDRLRAGLVEEVDEEVERERRRTEELGNELQEAIEMCRK